MPRATAKTIKKPAKTKSVTEKRSKPEDLEPVAQPVEEKRGARAPRRAATSGDELGAAEMAARVADSLRQFRQDRQLSLDDLANRSGVSRAALSQIEGRRTNPTLSVLWKVAVGLEIPFHLLLGETGDPNILVLRSGNSTALRSADGRTESRLLSPGGSTTSTEVYELRFQPRAIHKSEPHARGTTETLIVLMGNIRLTVDGGVQDVAAGDSVFFRADVAHSYENPMAREARCINVIHYAR